jgi:hypothetical protein
MKKWSFVALLVVGATTLGATVLSEPIANAAQNLNTTIIGPLDSNGNVKVHEQGTAAVHEQGTAAVNVTNASVPVHEQGTADVNVTNSSLSVAPPAPITDGGNFQIVGGGQTTTLAGVATATALAIHLTSGVHELVLSLGPLTPTYRGLAWFLGPGNIGRSDLVLPLSRPVKFDTIICMAPAIDECSVSWVGNAP